MAAILWLAMSFWPLVGWPPGWPIPEQTLPTVEKYGVAVTLVSWGLRDFAIIEYPDRTVIKELPLE